MCRTLAGIDLQKAGETADLVVDLYLALLPVAKDYDAALENLQKDAQGKKPEDAKNLVSAQAFEKIANDVAEVEFALDLGQIKAIAKHLHSVTDIALLYNLKK